MSLFHLIFQDNQLLGREYIREKLLNVLSIQKLMLEVLLQFICNAWSEILASDLEITNIKLYTKQHEKSYSLADLKDLMQVHHFYGSQHCLLHLKGSVRKTCFRHSLHRKY